MIAGPWGALFVPPRLDGPTLDILCEALVQLNVNYLKADRHAPRLYESGVPWRDEDGTEQWLTIPWVLFLWQFRGMGSDCEDLAAWRCAELRVRDREPSARCVWTAQEAPGVLVYHIRVRRADGRVEDPSAILGMR